GALEERRVNRADGMVAHRRHAGGEEDGVFLRDADVVVAIRHRLLQSLQTGAARHGRSDADNGVVLLTELDHRLAENILPIRRRVGFGRGSRAGLDVIRAGAVEFFGVLNCDVVAYAFLRQDVQHDWQAGCFGVFQHVDQQRQVMAVNWPDVAQAHFFEDDAVAETATAVRAQRTVSGPQGDFGDGAFEALLGFVREPQRQLTFR